MKQQIEILTPDGKKVQLNIQENTEIRKVKNDCELLCGIPSDIHVLQLEGRDVDDDNTVSDLNISEGCTLKLTVPQWWQKFVSTCYKGDTKQVRKRIHVNMSEITREERGFTAAFIAAVQGNHSLMFAAFAGQKINLLSKTKLSGRNLLHAAVSGGSTSCVANILMNGGNALLEAPDEKGETPVDLAERLYGGKDGNMVNFLNTYLELHRRETNNYGDSKRYWDNLEKNSNNSDENSTKNESKSDDGCISPSDENVISNVGNQNISQAGLNFVVTETLGNKNVQNVPTVSKINIEDYDAKTCSDALLSTSENFPETAEGKRNPENIPNVICCKQGNAHTSDTGYYSSGGHSVKRDDTETNWNDNLFTQRNPVSAESEMTIEVFDSSEQTVLSQADSAKNMSTTAAEQNVARDCASNQPASRRRAQLSFTEQKRKRSTTERPNLEQLITGSDNHDNQEHENEQVPEKGQNADETHEEVAKADVTDDLRAKAQGPTITSYSNEFCENCPSPKPLRRAQLRKKSIVEQRRRKSLAQRPNVEELETARQGVEDGENLAEKTSVGTVQDKTDIDISESIDKLTIEAGQREGSDNLTTTTSQRMLQQKIDGEIFKNMTTNSGNKTSAIGDNGPEKNEAEIRRDHHTEGYKRSESLGDESPVSAKNILKLWQDQSHEVDLAGSSTGDEGDAESRSPKQPRRALARKQVYMEQRRKKSATERPDVLKLLRRNIEWEKEDANQNSDGAESKGKRDIESLVVQNNFSVTNEEQVNAGPYDPLFPVGNVSGAQDETVELGLRQLAQSELNKERTPIRRAQRCPNIGLLARNRTQDTRSRSWSSVSGGESDESDQERAVVAEPIAPIAHGSKAKATRRRRLPILPDIGIKLPVIKIEDSGISRELTTMTALQPALGRSRSGSTCSEDSTSSAEMSSARAR